MRLEQSPVDPALAWHVRQEWPDLDIFLRHDVGASQWQCYVSKADKLNLQSGISRHPDKALLHALDAWRFAREPMEVGVGYED